MAKRSIVHIEIPAANREAATKFYGELFDWDNFEPLPIGYTYFSAGNNMSGGFPDVGDWKPGDVILYVSSDDIDADLKKVNAMGGKTIIPKHEIPGKGWFAWFMDPTGNKIALFTDI